MVDSTLLTRTDLEFENAQLLQQVAARQQEAFALESYNALLYSVMTAMRYLVTADDFNTALQKVLSVLSVALDVERGYIYEQYTHPESGERLMSQRFVWVCSGGETLSESAGSQNLTYGDLFVLWHSQLTEGVCIHGLVTMFPPAERALLEAQGTASVLVLPILVQARLWGCLRFDVQYAERTWSEREIAALEAAADSIGGAIQRQQMERDLQRRSRNLALINHASQAFSSTLDLDYVLVTVLDEVRRLLDVVACSIWLMDFETDELVCRQATGPQADIVRGWRLAPGEGFVGHVVRYGESLIVPDLRQDARHFKAVDQHTGLQLRSILTTPLHVNQEVIGVLQVVDTKVNRFSSSDLEFLEPLAASAAIAIENAFLYGETEVLRAFNENIVQSMEEGILLADGDGYITFVNAKMRELVGYAPEDLIGRHWTILIPPEYVAEARKEITRCMQGALSGMDGTPDYTSRYESMLLMQDGQRVPVLVSTRPLSGELPRSGNGEGFAGVLTVFTDITERRRAEEVLRQRYEELITLNSIATTLGQSLNLSNALAATLGKVLDVLDIKGGWIHLLDREGPRLSLVVQRGCSPEMASEMQSVEVGEGFVGNVVQLGQPVILAEVPEQPYLGIAPGACVGLHAFAALPAKAKDRVLGVLGVFSHTPRRLNSQEIQLLTAIAHHIGVAVENARLAEEASEIEILREVNRLRSELIANVSHELRTPLGLVKVFCTSLLMDDVDFDQETRLKFLLGIDEQTDRLEVIVDNLLDLSRVESGRLHLDLQPVDLGKLAADTVKAMEVDMKSTTMQLPEVPRTPHRFVVDLPDHPLIVNIDAKRIEQVLRNLLSNAVKYSPNGGKIIVQVRGDKWQILVRVSDEGIGIPSQDVERIFERFYRVKNETTYSTHGTGLGLSVCRGIVKAHGGRIWVDSTLGVGSNFYFTIPVME
ncbi:MAG: GAF domain-containing protein [Anaerolineae bacterium]|nr:GAF domain-containing protein [Anaerolineae bacterium]